MAASAPFALAEKAAEHLLRLFPAPEVALVLGSGWKAAAAELGPTDVTMPTAYLPGFVAPTVAGHAGSVSCVRAGERAVLVLSGRSHLYEGRTPAEVVHPVRTAVAAGARAVVLTNAAGSLRGDLGPGQAVLVRDHINLTGASPLSGPPPPAPYAPRFVDLTDLYTPRLRQLARTVDPGLPEGVYAGLLGPHFETPAEVAMLRGAGADLVGMSTVLEAIAVRHLGAEVLAISLVTNFAAGVAGEEPGGTPAPAHPIDHREVLATGEAAAASIGRLLGKLLPLI